MIPRLLYGALLLLAVNLALSSAKVRVFAMRAYGLQGDVRPNPPDPYLKVWCGSAFGGMTEFQRDVHNPVWHAEFNFPHCKANDDLKVEVWDKDLQYDDHLGTCATTVKSGFSPVSCSLTHGGVSYNYELK